MGDSLTDSQDMLGFARGLRRIVTLLGSPPGDQLAHLQRLGPGDLADELALEFDDMYRVVPELRYQGHLSEEAERALNAIDVALAQMSEQPDDIWLQASLLYARQWQQVRGLARAALLLLPA